MSRAFNAAFIALAAPATFPILAAFAVGGAGLLPPDIAVIAPYVPYAVLIMGILLSWRFAHRNASLLLVLLFLAARTLSAEGVEANAAVLPRELIYTLLSVILPVTGVLLAVTKERGYRTLAGLGGLSIALGPALLLATVAAVDPDTFLDLISVRILPNFLVASNHLSHVAIIAFGIAAIVLGWRVAVRRLPLDAGYLVCLLAAGAALHLGHDPLGRSAFLAAAGLALAVAVIQDSYRMAFLDELTGLPGRRALRLECQRLGGRYAIAMLDVDHFKKFNDTYGHDVGDQVLRMVAASLTNVTGGGRPFRYGGEEFTVLFPGRSVKEVTEDLEALRERIATTPFRIRSKGRPKRKPDPSKRRPRDGGPIRSVQITASIGVAERNDANRSPDLVIKAADKALYRAKNKGRNRVSR